MQTDKTVFSNLPLSYGLVIALQSLCALRTKNDLQLVVLGLPRDHPESYHYYMWNEFFKHIDIDPQNAHILDGNADDLVKECDSFEAKIKDAGGVELFIGGIGPDGHIAFNEPGSSLTSRTRVKTLAQDTLEANARFFNNDISKVPKQALTVGVATVMDAKEVMILITGAHKSFALYKAIEEGVNHMWTVSAFQVSPRGYGISHQNMSNDCYVSNYFSFIQQHFLFAMRTQLWNCVSRLSSTSR